VERISASGNGRHYQDRVLATALPGHWLHRGHPLPGTQAIIEALECFVSVYGEGLMPIRGGG
jgi:hypothetical protein